MSSSLSPISNPDPNLNDCMRQKRISTDNIPLESRSRPCAQQTLARRRIAIPLRPAGAPPRTPRFLEEGGRIPGPPGKSVWSGPLPSRVRPGGDAALDRPVPSLTARYKLRIESLHVYRLARGTVSQPLLKLYDPTQTGNSATFLRLGMIPLKHFFHILT